MNSGKRLLSTSLLVCAGTLSLANIQRRGELPGTEQYLGLAIAFFLLSATADLGAEGIAGGFSLLLLITVLLTRGEDALAYALGKAGRKPQERKIRRAQRRTTQDVAAAIAAGFAADAQVPTTTTGV